MDTLEQVYEQVISENDTIVDALTEAQKAELKEAAYEYAHTFGDSDDVEVIRKQWGDRKISTAIVEPLADFMNAWQAEMWY